MSKNPNSKSKQVKRDEPMNGAMKFFLAGCVAEFYLLLLRRFYVNGTLEQVVAWDQYLTYFLYAGLVLLVVGLVFALILWRQAPKKRQFGWLIFGAGLFLALSSLLVRSFYASALTLLSIIVPVAMLLGILWCLYDRECAWALSILGTSLIALWVCRRGLGSVPMGTYIRIGAVAYLLLLIVFAALARQADQKDGLIGKLRVLPVNADVLPIYLACGLSGVGIIVALVSATVAYYAMWALAVVVFALAVYYTVKQL